MDTSEDMDIAHEMNWTWLRRENIKREMVLQLIAVRT